MRLEDLYENFGLVSSAQQLEMLIAYRIKRLEDLDKPARTPAKRKTAIKKAPVLTEKEKAAMKLLGLKQKDFFALRESLNEDAPEGEDLVLFQDDTFNDED